MQDKPWLYSFHSISYATSKRRNELLSWFEIHAWYYVTNVKGKSGWKIKCRFFNANQFKRWYEVNCTPTVFDLKYLSHNMLEFSVCWMKHFAVFIRQMRFSSQLNSLVVLPHFVCDSISLGFALLCLLPHYHFSMACKGECEHLCCWMKSFSLIFICRKVLRSNLIDLRWFKCELHEDGIIQFFSVLNEGNFRWKHNETVVELEQKFYAEIDTHTKKKRSRGIDGVLPCENMKFCDRWAMRINFRMLYVAQHNVCTLVIFGFGKNT